MVVILNTFLPLSLCIMLVCCALSVCGQAASENELLKGGLDVNQSVDTVLLDYQIKYNMRKSEDLDDEGCFLQTGHNEALQQCGFNTTARTILIIHGWTIGGVFESWMYKLVSAVVRREAEANVIVVDWLDLAHQLYPDAVNHTLHVGRSIAALLDWLQEAQQLPLENVHLIGYSLGAHVAGYAGTFVHGKVGRITGLDPAGPMFEGAEPHKRLSPDDAEFVDVLHTYTREALGVSIGIQQPIGHIDIYPNGGDVQPGCALGDVLSSAAAGDFMEVMKCEHERAVHLFVDSLMDKEHVSFAYQCTGPERFNKGICLSCRKNRCNNVGYNARSVRRRRNSKMYLKTRADTPFAGHADGVGLNLTNTFLVFTEKDIGELLKIRLTWESPTESFSAVWKHIKSFWSTSSSTKVLQVRRIRIKCGETQRKFTFCAEDLSVTDITPGNSLTFVKCRDGWEVKPRKWILM
ncbi:hypothetical protein QTP70_034590 [Hemibagrus guttatus]|uniref:PLAT domain-containing protein n=1 Tax=Hemibagrus guttatus TaxID=175788 RepID=A0AAE0R3S0_9TELE|nr:hypothetical protein QTP70_034590 [Hemibagrus guttatus]